MTLVLVEPKLDKARNRGLVARGCGAHDGGCFDAADDGAGPEDRTAMAVPKSHCPRKGAAKCMNGQL